jgi:hypothetical protein
MTSKPNTSVFVNCTYALEPPYTDRYVRWCERSAGAPVPASYSIAMVRNGLEPFPTQRDRRMP